MKPKQKKKKKKKKNAWMRELRTWIVYAMSPDARNADDLELKLAQAARGIVKGLRVYFGITSIKPTAAVRTATASTATAVSERVAQHEKDAAKGSRCPVHVAMRRSGNSKWAVSQLHVLPSATYHEAMAAERRIARNASSSSIQVLNRRSLSC